MALLLACDLPCLTTEAVSAFMDQVEKNRVGLSYGMVSREVSEAAFPGTPHTYVRLKEGTFCGSGLFAMAPQYFPSLRSFTDRSARSRKSIIKLTQILGIPFLIKLLLKRLSLRDVEERASELFGFPARGIPSEFPEIAFNVDDPRSLSLAATFLQRRTSPWTQLKS